jgi:hypothetical protein
MKTSLCCFICGLFTFLTATAFAQTSPPAPAFPPKQWQVWLQMNLSKDLLHQFLEDKPAKDEFYYFEGMDFWLDAEGGLKAPRKHPVLTGKIPSNNFADRESVIGGGAICHIPKRDQKEIYEKALETVRSFRFVDDFKPETYDASGIDLMLRVEINGRSFSVDYRKLQVADGLPKPVLEILACMRRGLPKDYDRFFNFLRVPKLAALPPEEAEKFAQCLVHKEWMKSEEVTISYGFPAPREKYWKAAGIQFPNARYYIHAGCVITPGSPKSGQVLYCNSCRAAEKAWVKQNE